MKYKIEKFEKPITKPYEEVKKYDVARFEYGDYDNWVNAIILNITKEKENTLKIECVTEYGRVFECYGFIYFGKHNFDIIGTATELTKEDGLTK